MIQLEKIHIENFRGIRNLTLEMKCESFAIQGPNGSGKSGVVDAIEFGLTGKIARFSGRGTQGLKLKECGQHIACEDLTKAFVRLKVQLPTLSKSATIVRCLKDPGNPTIEPADPDIIAVFNDVQLHPEIALSRRQIIRLILIEASDRSKKIQSLLRLDTMEGTRAAFKKAMTTAKKTYENAKKETDRAGGMQPELENVELNSKSFSTLVNSKRRILGVAPISNAIDSNSVTEGLADSPKAGRKVVKSAAIRGFDSLNHSLCTQVLDANVQAIQNQLEILETDPALYAAFRRQQLVELGLEVLDDESCPLCDQEWDIAHLTQHLKAKQALSSKAKKIENVVMSEAVAIVKYATEVCERLNLVCTAARQIGQPQLADMCVPWLTSLQELESQLKTLDGVIASRDKLNSNWQRPDANTDGALIAIGKHLEALPECSAETDAYNFLINAKGRLNTFLGRQGEEEKALRLYRLASTVYKSYESATESVLESLYQAVAEDFNTSYRAINSEDESDFAGLLSTSGTKLDLTVDFQQKGQVHPAAYHSEGHQDGMGLCLYLALMKQVFADNFRFVVLDDVVMSVDSQHRKKLCKLLKDSFPNTQFIITTHEKAWFKQLRKSGLINSRSSVTFRGWTLEDGPIVNHVTCEWEAIDAALKNDEVPAAAASLRQHMEYESFELAGELGASVRFRPDADYSLGDLLPPVVNRLKTLLGKASTVAHEWKNIESKNRADDLKIKLNECYAATEAEQWAVNKSIHYNVWTNLVKEDLVPVVAAFKKLVDCFKCTDCRSPIHAIQDGNTEAIKCDCGNISFNLKRPTRDQKSARAKRAPSTGE